LATKQFIVLPNLTGHYGEASVTLTNPTFLLNSRSEKHYPDKYFGAWLVTQINERVTHFAKTSGFFGILKKKYLCPSCSGQLDPNPREPVSTVLEMNYKDFTPFSLQITIPSVTCPKCGFICAIDVNDPPGSMIFGAINNAFEKESIRI
jgi:hypothetical protein